MHWKLNIRVDFSINKQVCEEKYVAKYVLTSIAMNHYE
jgi:hypothetical protein